jgi:hypothetical protein
MNDNLYQTPRSVAEASYLRTNVRNEPQWRVRTALLILLVPAIYNFVCFSYAIGNSQNAYPFFVISLAMNSLGFIFVVATVWFFGLKILELITWLAYRLMSRKDNLDDWLKALHLALDQTPMFAVLGAILWIIWVVGFYHLQVGFYAISVPLGIVAHLLAAALYLPLFYSWYRM